MDLTSPSLHGVPPGGFPRFRGTMRGSDSSSPFPGASGLPRHPVPVRRTSSSLRDRGDARTPRGLVRGHPVDLPGIFTSGDEEVSQVPGKPLWKRAPLFDPVGGEPPRPVCRRLPVAFRILNRVGLRTFQSFEAQSRSPFPRCLRFAGRVTPYPRKTRYRLAWSALAGRDSHPLGSIVEFQGLMTYPFLSTQAWPGALRRSGIGR